MISFSVALVPSVDAADGDGGLGGYTAGTEVAASASLTGVGANGENGGSTGGGGGGAGATGGTGGTSGSGGAGGDGGAHAYVGDGSALTSGTLALTGGAGGDGVTPGSFGGGGGGGGGFGAVVTGASNLSVSDGAISGGDGGDGGGSPTHYGGRGGSGGSGLVLNNVSGTASVQADVSGGDGGNGGNAANGLQNPGANGGTGIRVVGNGGPVALTVSGAVAGGDGGNAGTSSQYATAGGDGGAGISGSNINVVLTGAASVSGGIGGTAENGGTAGSSGRAINFTGGSNSLELQAGSGGGVATISGGISHTGSGDKLVLGGTNDASLAVSGLNGGGLYAGFGSYEKTGSSTWTLTGTTASTRDWSIANGTLRLSDASIGSGAVSIASGATLEINRTAAGAVANAISGAGTLVKSGAGTLTLTGANTYTGGTTVTAGRLVGSVTAVRGAVSVASGAVLEYNQASNATLVDVISGAGSLAKSGAGTLTLTGANTYAGGTMITAGRLLGSTGAIRGDVAVSSGATVEYRQSSDATLSNVISGAGSLIKSGAGALTLTGTNTYSGGTTVSAGRLVGSTSAIRGDVAVSSGATVEYSQSSDATLGNVVSGAGSLTKSGASTLTLSGANTYAGGTTVKGGRLVASTTSISGDIQVDAGAAFRFDQAVDGEYSGGISGAGSLEKSGAGVLTLTGNFSLTGKTSVYNGELIVAASNLGTSAAFDLSGGGLTVTGSANATISTLQMGASDGILKLLGGNLTVSDAVTSTRSLSLTGAGTLNLDATGSNIGGGVTLSNGSLIVGSSSSKKNASLAADLAVASGATLGGHGTITGTVTNAGMLAPGNSIGTLTIAGNYAGTGTLQIEVEGDQSSTARADKLIVNGTVDVSGTNLDLVLTPATATSWAYAPTGPFIIIENDGADAITGTFASVTDNLLFLDPSLNYAAGTGNDLALTLERNDIDFASAARTRNQSSTASAIEGLGAASAIYKGVVATVSSDALAQAAFDSLSGEINASLRSVLINDSRLSRGAVLSHLASSQAWSPIWGQAIGNWNSFAGDGNAAAASSATGGFVYGFDHAYSDAVTIGLMGGYTRTGVSVGARSSNADMEALQAGIYLGGVQGGWNYKAGLLGAYNTIETDRVAAVSGAFSQSLNSAQQILSAQAFVETGYAFNVKGVRLEPFAGLAQVHLRNSGFSEQGGSAALTAAAQHNNVTFSWIGLRTEADLSLFGVDTTVKASAAWQHASAKNASFSHGFAGGSAFTINGASFARDMALIETGVTMKFDGGAALDLSYQGQFASNVKSHGFNGRLSAKF